MMLPQTDFRPQIHGFDFDNSWDTDDNYRNFIKEKLTDAVPIVVKIIVENPALGGALIASMGAIVAVGEALTGGLFETVIIPATINQIIDAVDDKIKDFIPDHYGACGGMAFASLDYYYSKWIIPKGFNKRTHDDPNKIFNVPPKDSSVDQTLRNYIYDRLKDTYDDGGVQDKMLEWYIILNTFPPGIGGGPEIQSRTKDEWVKITGLLDQHKPQPICILYDVLDIFDNHQVVAYGYGGDPFSGDAFLNIYDNNFPNAELAILFTFVNEQIEGTITSVINLLFNDQGFTVNASGTRITDFSTIKFQKNTEVVKGFFYTEYSPKTPPVGWGIESGLTVLPAAIQSEGEYFSISGKATNAFTFFEKEHTLNKTRFYPIVEEALHMPQITGIGNIMPHLEAVFGFNKPVFTENKRFDRQGDFILFAKARVLVINEDGSIKDDSFGMPLSRILYLPAHTSSAQSYVHIKVLQALTIIPYNKSGISCYQPFIEGQNAILMVDKNPFPNDTLKYRWTVEGVQTSDTSLEKLELFNLPPASTKFKVKVQITNTTTGAIASGELTITTYSSQEAQHFTTLCEATHIITHIVNPRLFDPLGPDNPDLRKYLQKNAREIGAQANRLFQLTKRIEEFSSKERK